MKIACHPNHSLCSRETRVPGHAPERDDIEGEMELRPVLSFSLRTPLAEKMLILIIYILILRRKPAYRFHIPHIRVLSIDIEIRDHNTLFQQSVTN